jgi:hypothetical protein
MSTCSNSNSTCRAAAAARAAAAGAAASTSSSCQEQRAVVQQIAMVLQALARRARFAEQVSAPRLTRGKHFLLHCEWRAARAREARTARGPHR